jgi:cyclopropane fatty-acyl-phospholipid synthase-like methyltransferase
MIADMFEEAYSKNPAVFGFVPTPGLEEVVEALEQSAIATALDLGCGQGRDTLYLLSKNLTVTAVDRSPAGIAALRDQAPSNLVVRLKPIAADVDDFPAWQGIYDLIVGVTILDHLQPAAGERLLKRSIECLRPGGIIFLCVHTTSDPGYTNTGSVSEFSRAILHYFQPNELLTWAMKFVTVLKYVDRVETDRDHGPVHQHGLAYLVGRKDS